MTTHAMACLPYLPESVPAARRLVREKLTEWRMHQLLDDAELIMTELASNAVRTGCLTRMRVRVQWITRTCVRISVRDGSRTMPVLLRATESAECHRGVALVHTLTKGQWGVTLDPYGKTVHADLRLDNTPPMPGDNPAHP
ncbi:ATP-binding protein [Kitasatospora sp. NPDC002040]|uniref:ATP-binding protein n=1 Tax=Kitasatospora sp. NPDC002040 TaxID=3154661 RepID=UPI0033229501